MCLEASIDATTAGSDDKAAVKAPTGPKAGLTTQTISQGSKPLNKNTAIKSPEIKNHLLALADIVDKTSALMMALSTEEIVSNKINPATTKTIDRISISLRYNCIAKNDF